MVRRTIAMLKLMLVEDGKTLWEMPLQARNWDRRSLRHEFDEMENEMKRFEGLFNALANEGRMRMMRSFFDVDHSRAFTELMNELGMNPKIVSDSTKRLRRTGFIEKDDDGRYRPTRSGEAQFLMMSVAMRRMLEILDQL
ncbi:MAG: winged helix-turn-helix transcriptional regulator [Candidatus Bathyarchaeota archaeon]|nr:MAG: winged helix-turn-helix transcriptional regulator [Candidatus Bathyarchaeota archaeon]